MIAAGTVALLVGTMKGAFVLTSDERGADWSISDINIPGGDVFHLAYDARDGTLYAAANSVVFGPDIQKSTDLGATWEPCRGTTSGQVFFSRDEGDNWDLLIDSLPPINSVDAATLA